MLLCAGSVRVVLSRGLPRNVPHSQDAVEQDSEHSPGHGRLGVPQVAVDGAGSLRKQVDGGGTAEHAVGAKGTEHTRGLESALKYTTSNT